MTRPGRWGRIATSMRARLHTSRSRRFGVVLAVGALVCGCGSGRPSEPVAAPAARVDAGGSPDAPAVAPPAAQLTEPAVAAALADAIARDDGRAMADVIDPDYGLTLYSTQGIGSGHTVLDVIAVGETTAPSRRPRRVPLGAPRAWASTGWRGVAAGIAFDLDGLVVEPNDPSSPSFGFCRGQYGLPGDGAPISSYLRRERDDRDLHMFDTPDRAPLVPPLAGLTVIGNSRLRVSLRRSAVGWRAVHIVLDDRCRGSPDN